MTESRKKVYKSYFQSQIAEIRTGGWHILIRKTVTISKQVTLHLGIIISAPFVLLIIILKPIIHIRFGIMTSHRIGHFAGDTEAYLCSRDRERKFKKTIDIIGCPDPVCNRFLLKKWVEHIRIRHFAFLWQIMDRSCRFWTKGEKHHVKLYDRGNDYHLFIGSEPHLSFTEEEHQRGRDLLREMGIPEGESYICIHNRDNAYLKKSFGTGSSYHDHRDYSIQTLIAASEELSYRGYYVVRVGSVVAEALVSSNTKIVDYASSNLRSDFADIYLLGNCRFFLGNDSGIWCIPLIFRKPLAMVNFNLMSNFFEKDYKPWYFIHKHFRDKKTQRNLILREIFEMGLANATAGRLFENARVELICNTPEEIRDLSIEVEERLRGQWRPQPEDEKLQSRFWEIFRECSPIELGEIHVRIGANFLRNNKYLLD